MKSNLPFVVLLLSACAGGARSDDPSGRPLAGPQLAFPSVFALIGEREELGLTSQQVTTLDSIGVWLSAENQALLRELEPLESAGGRSRGRRTSGRVDQTAELDDESRAVLERVRGNNTQAMQMVERTLTPEQRTRVCELDRQQREARMRELGRGGRSTSRRRPSPGMAPDSTRGMRRGGWSWCGSGIGVSGEAAPLSGGAS